MKKTSLAPAPGPARHRRAPLLSLLGAVALLLLGAASASAADPIEGVWSFSGGKVAIQANPSGGFTGVIVAPTKFDECVHEVGEEVWTGIAPQADGSYWGQHQWFSKDGTCTPTETRGLTAWRVMTTSSGGRFLRVCFSNPGSSKQPTIDPAGESANTAFGCLDSMLVGSLPQTPPTLATTATLPPANACLPSGKLRIPIRDRAADPLKKVKVVLRSGGIRRLAKVKHRKHGYLATVDLGGLPSGPATVRLRLVTALGHKIIGKRTYALCSAKSS